MGLLGAGMVICADAIALLRLPPERQGPRHQDVAAYTVLSEILLDAISHLVPHS